jgi:hypothetical protein
LEFLVISTESTSSLNFGEVRSGWVENCIYAFSFVALKIALYKHPVRLNIRRVFIIAADEIRGRLISEAVWYFLVTHE